MKPLGYAVWSHEDGRTTERDTITCAHCQRIVFMVKGQDIGGFCRMCMKGICGPCADQGSCTPFEKKLEQQDRRERLYKAAMG